MKYKSALMTAASGSIGGITASHNRGGNYFRARVTPTDPSTCRQKKLRASMAGVVNSWTQTLTPEQRQGWQEYASNVPSLPAFCGPMDLTGQQHFIRSNVPRVAADFDLVLDAPTIFNTGQPPLEFENFTYNPSTGDISMEVPLAEPAGAAGNLLLYQGGPQNPSVNFYAGPYQLATQTEVAPTDDVVVVEFNIATSLSDYSLSLDHKTPWRAAIIYDDGRLSAEAKCMLAPTEEPTS